jgi:RND family efflux transporter MFP subunit
MRATDRFQLFIVMLVAACAAGCGAAPEPPRAPRPVRVAAVETAAPSGDLRYSAVLQPKEQVALAFKIGGYVGEILRVGVEGGGTRLVQQGDAVRRGTTLARLDSRDYDERVRQAAAQRAESQASLERARADAGRAERLYATQSLTRPDYDAATAGLRVAEARVAGAEAALAAADLVLRDCSLVAPMDAVILSRTIEPGALAGAGTVAFQLADVSSVKAVFGAPDDVAAALALGLPMSVRVDGRKYTGRISAISPSAEGQSRVFGVEVTVDNASRALKPGTVATALVPPAAPRVESAPGPTVPLAAIVKSTDGAYAVFVVDGAGDRAVARARKVGLGAIAGDRIAVEEGLKSGDTVVVSGATLLTDGEPVRIIP